MRGKLGATLTFDNPEEDHPRGCGENLPIEYNAVPVIGSPPRMRGKLMFEIDSCGNVGITPADAGKTFFDNVNRKCYQDHPRGCGENFP